MHFETGAVGDGGCGGQAGGVVDRTARFVWTRVGGRSAPPGTPRMTRNPDIRAGARASPVPRSWPVAVTSPRTRVLLSLPRTANDPTPPAAPMTITCCPGWTRPQSRTPCSAVTPETGTTAGCSKETLAGLAASRFCGGAAYSANEPLCQSRTPRPRHRSESRARRSAPVTDGCPWSRPTPAAWACEVRGVGLLMRMANYAVASSGCTMPDPGGTPGLRGCRLDLGVVPVCGPPCAEWANEGSIRQRIALARTKPCLAAGGYSGRYWTALRQKDCTVSTVLDPPAAPRDSVLTRNRRG